MARFIGSFLSTETDSKRLEHFWLCGECSKSMILTCVKSEVTTTRLMRVGTNQVRSAG
jgi:hypothetical protein